MAYVPKVISLTEQDAKWIVENHVNLSHYVRWAIEISRETDKHDLRELVARLRLANQKLLELVSAYENDRKIIREDVK